MSEIEKKVELAIKELAQAYEKLGAAGAHLAVHMAVCTVLGTEESQEIRLRAVKALARGAERYAAGTLALADQMKAELQGLTK